MTKAKAAAATSVPTTAMSGKGAMAIPATASVAAMRMSRSDDAASHRLGREDQIRRRSRLLYVVAWLPKTMTTKASVLQPIDVESGEVRANSQDGHAKRQLAESHDGAGDRQIADSPDIGQRRGPHVVRRQRHPEDVADDHDQRHQQRRQDRLPGHDEPDRDEEHLHDLLVDGVERIRQDSLKDDAALL